MSAETDRVARGMALCHPAGMSAMTRALHDRFEEVCRLELVRLRRKTASLTL